MIKTEEVLEIEGIKVPEFLYLVGKTGTWKWNNKRRTNVTVPYMADEVGMLYNRNFDAECIAGSDSVDDVNLRDIIFDSEKKYGKNTFIKKVSGINKVWTGHTQNRPSWFSVVIHGYNKEGREIYNSGRVGRYDVGGYKDSTAYTFPWSVTLPEHARVVIQVWGHLGNPYHDNSGCDNTMDGAQVYNVKLDDFIHKADGETNLVINEDYKPEYMKFNSSTIENLRPLALENSINGVRIASTKGDGFLHLDPNDTLEINGQKHSLTSSNLSEQKLKLNKIDLSYKVESGKIQLKVDNYGLKVPSPQPLNIKIIKHKEVSDIMNHRINLTVPYIEKVIGESFLEVKEYYPTSEYIKFNSCTLNNPTEIKLENSIRDVKLNQVTGKGLVNLEEGNILEVNGKRYSIGSGGNLSEKNDTLGDIKFKFKVEGGKLRLALNEWGILEPDRLLRINAEKIDKTPIMEHILKIRSPRRVEGTNNIKIDNNYQIRNVIKFSGISLNAPSSFALESPIPTGVTLAEQSGYGIPYLDEGDIIQIDDGRTRSVHSYTVQSKGTLLNQRIEFNNGSIDLLVVNRKVQVRLNNWKVNEPMRLSLKAIRGTNEISNHVITLTMPKAPFNQVTTGNLDFGTVLQGARNKKAESNIRIEMLEGQDVSEVKFNLREEQPVMVNSQGTELKVKKIDKTVQRVRDKEYNIKLRGTLDVPEDQQNGEYRGSNILDIEVK